MDIQFILSQKGDLKNINLLISINEQIIKTRTPLKIHQDQWDCQKQRPYNIYIKIYKKINFTLDQIKITLTQYISNKLKKNQQISQRAISGIIKNIIKEKRNLHPENSLLSLMQSYIEERIEAICNSTYKRYKVFFNLIQRFEGFVRQKLLIHEINPKCINEFILFGKQEDYSENTIYRTIHFIKTIMNYAERTGVRTRVREIIVRREKQKKQFISLTEDEIIAIKKTTVPQELQPAKDWLIISCYTGQRFSDFINFSSQKLLDIQGKTCISFIQQKTKKEVLLPLHPEVINAISRNQNQFPMTMHIKDYNKQIKQISMLAGINKYIKAKKRIGHRIKDLVIEKWNFITSHIGRRSFASNFYGKIPTPLLMEATGHSTEQMFLKYINPIDKSRVIKLGNHFDNIYKEKITT